MPTRDEIIEALTQLSAAGLEQVKTELERRWRVEAVVRLVDHPRRDVEWGRTSNPPSVFRGDPEVTLTLVAAGPNRLAVIQIVREVMRLGLGEARDLVDALPRRFPLPQGEVEPLAARLKAAGAEVVCTWE